MALGNKEAGGLDAALSSGAAGERSSGRPAGKQQLSEDMELVEGEQRQEEKAAESVKKVSSPGEVSSEIGFKRAAGTQVRKTTKKGKEVITTKVKSGGYVGSWERDMCSKSPLGASGGPSKVLFLDLTLVTKVFILIIHQALLLLMCFL